MSVGYADRASVFAVKILVFLIMPVDPTSHQVAKQVEYLQLFKASIVEGDAIAVVVSHLEEPLQNLERWVTVIAVHLLLSFLSMGMILKRPF